MSEDASEAVAVVPAAVESREDVLDLLAEQAIEVRDDGVELGQKVNGRRPVIGPDPT